MILQEPIHLHLWPFEREYPDQITACRLTRGNLNLVYDPLQVTCTACKEILFAQAAEIQHNSLPEEWPFWVEWLHRFARLETAVERLTFDEERRKL